MKAHLTKVSLALLSTVFLLGCQDMGSEPVGPEGLGPQFNVVPEDYCKGHHKNDPGCLGGGDTGSPFYQYTFTSSVINTDLPTAIGVAGRNYVYLSCGVDDCADEFLELNRDLLLDNTEEERQACFVDEPFTTDLWIGEVGQVKGQGGSGNEVFANILFKALDIGELKISYRLRLFGTAVTDGKGEGDGIFPPEVGETMTVDFTSYFIEPQRNSEENACSGAADLGADHPLATSIAIKGAPDATLPAT